MNIQSIVLALKSLIRFGIVITLICIGAEFGARWDDFVRTGVPIGTSPLLERDLQITQDGQILGKPFGVYMATQLNSLGFRGPELQVPKGRTRRVLLVGASETFGSPSRIDDQYAQYLQTELPLCEIVNTSVIGQNAASLLSQWNSSLKQLNPDTVVIYSSPYFYTRASYDKQPVNQTAKVETPIVDARFQSRFADKFKSSISIPQPIQRWRQLAVLREVTKKLPNALQLDAIPLESDDAYLSDLEALVSAISPHVNQVLLITHPISAHSQARPNVDSNLDLDDHLLNFQIRRPQFTQAAIAEFSYRIRKRVVAEKWPVNVSVVDLAGEIGGHKEFFRDLVHLNELGARKVARCLASAMTSR
jgi:hypothetical protein